MRKIIYIVTQSELGGAQKNVLDLAVALKNRYAVLVAAGPDGDDKLFKRLADNKVRWHKLKWLRRSAANPLIDLLGLIEIFLLLIKEKPHILHLHSSKAGFLGSLAGWIARVKVIYTVHGAVFEASFSRLARKFFLYLEKLGAYFKDKIICVSANDKKLWLDHQVAPAAKLFVVHNGLDLTKDFLSKPDSREYLASQSANFFEALKGSDNNIKIVGVVANFFPEKGLPYLIEVADILINKKRVKNLLFAVIGNGPDKMLLEKMIAEHGLENNFILISGLSQAAPYLKAFDVFVLPSAKEGLPYTILEAMAAGLPIVSTDRGAITESVIDGQNGFIVGVRRPEQLAERIGTLIDDPALRMKMGKKSRALYEEKFTEGRMVEKLTRVFRQVLDMPAKKSQSDVSLTANHAPALAGVGLQYLTVVTPWSSSGPRGSPLTASLKRRYAEEERHFRKRLENVIALAEGLTERSEVLDIGCGTGDIAVALHEKFKCRVTGIDFSQEMVEHCLTTHGDKGITFRKGNILALEIPDGALDTVLSLSVLEWVKDYRGAVAEVARVLKPGGRWIVSIPNWGSITRRLELLLSRLRSGSYLRELRNRHSPAELQVLARENGLTVEKSLYHVFPVYDGNFKGFTGPILGAMCILSLRKN